MMLRLLFLLALGFMAPAVNSQDNNFGEDHNATTIVGSWSTGAKNVRTGPNFANPGNSSFTYPKTAGVGISFSEDGFYEIARYRFKSNGSEPTCIVGIVNWSHGKAEILGNGSIVLRPFEDGYQQIQDPCAAVSNFVENYHQVELYKEWRIFRDPTQGFKLHLFQFDGAPLAPMFQISTTPEMLPTQVLRNIPSTEPTGNGVKKQTRRAVTENQSNDSAVNHHLTIALVATTVMVIVSIVSILL